MSNDEGDAPGPGTALARAAEQAMVREVEGDIVGEWTEGHRSKLTALKRFDIYNESRNITVFEMNEQHAAATITQEQQRSIRSKYQLTRIGISSAAMLLMALMISFNPSLAWPLTAMFTAFVGGGNLAFEILNRDKTPKLPPGK